MARQYPDLAPSMRKMQEELKDAMVKHLSKQSNAGGSASAEGMAA